MCGSVLQCADMRREYALQCVAVSQYTHTCIHTMYTCIHMYICMYTRMCILRHCNTLQRVLTTHVGTLQHTATHCNRLLHALQHTATPTHDTCQHIATHCHTLQHTATHTATHDNAHSRRMSRGTLTYLCPQLMEVLI